VGEVIDPWLVSAVIVLTAVIEPVNVRVLVNQNPALR